MAEYRLAAKAIIENAKERVRGVSSRRLVSFRDLWALVGDFGKTIEEEGNGIKVN